MELRWVPLLAFCPAAGCVSESVSLEAGDQKPVLDFGRTMVQSREIVHEVHLFFEMYRPPKTDEERGLLSRLQSGEDVEEYTAAYSDERSLEEIHRFSYQKGKFKVAEFSYPAQRNGMLFIFREAPGPFGFSFRDVKVRVERGSPWKPAVLYLKVEEKQELDPPAGGRSRTAKARKRVVTRLLQEELQVGPHRLIAFPNTRVFEVNGSRLLVPAGGTITIAARGTVRTSK